MLVGLIATTALLGAFAAPALAVKIHPFISKFNLPGSNAVPGGIAVDQDTHHVYVVKFADSSPGAVYDFEADGKLNAAHPQLTGVPTNAQGIAVDNSGGAKDGYIYVSALSEGIQQFDPSGAATAVQIKAAAIPANGTPQGGGLPPVVNNGEFAPRGIAVDGSGKIYVADESNKAIDEFSASGEFIAQVGAGLVEANAIAVGPGGNIYLATSQGLQERDASGNCVNACASIDPARAGGVAVDAAGNVLVTAINAPESSVNEYDPSGNLISSSGVEQLNTGYGIALDEGNGRLYVGDIVESTHGPDVRPDVKVFGELLTLPDAITLPATVAGQSVTLNGEVGADGGESATCLFQYTEEATFAVSGFQGASTTPCAPGGPFTGEALAAVSANLNLNAGTTYRYRLLGTSPAGSTPGTAVAFTTGGPSIRSQTIGGISETTATLEATINPNGHPTTYYFEYVDQAHFEAEEFTGATKVPLAGEAIGDGSQDVEVAEEIGGLLPGTGYHFRAVAIDDLGEEAVGAEVSFVTYAAANPFLPDARVYEQASPTDKNGANVEGGTNAVQAAEDGNAVTFFSVAGIPGGEGAQNYPLFLARRGASDWSTRGLAPPAATGPRGKVLGWSEDLSWAFSSNYFPGTPGTLYARDNASGATSEIATGLAGSKGAPGEPVPGFAGVGGAGGSTVAFEDTAKLAEGAKAGKANVYLWNRETGQLRLGSALNSGQAPGQGAFAGPYGWFNGTAKEEEQGGASNHYYTQASHVISADASRLFFTTADKKQLYVRINPLQEQSPLSGGACTDPAAACTVQVSASQASTPDPAGEQPAIFAEATPDGRYVLFISAGKLTDDATAGRQLYRYDTESGELVDLTVDTSSEGGADVLGVLGMSADGSHAYFAANGALVSGAAPGNCQNGGGGICSIYAWHEGETTLISRVSAQGSIDASDGANWIPTTNLPGPTEKTARVDPGGKVLLFRSQLPLTAYDNDGRDELYRSELTASGRTLQCVSCNPTNAAPGGDASLQAIPPKLAAPRAQAATLTRNLSAGGGRVFFDTPDKLVVADTNGVNDVYEWEAKGTGSCNSDSENGGCLYLLSSGTSPLPSYFADASTSGNDAFFFTTQALVRRDRDEIQDVYDARVGGGFDEPPPQPPCLGEACLGAQPPTPSFTSPATEAAGGPGNLKPLKCKKGFKKVKKKGKTKCVKVHHKGKKHQGKSKRGGRAAK